MLQHQMLQHSIMMQCALCILLLTISHCGCAKATPTAAKRVVNIRSKEDIDLNCPSISYRFPQGTLRCESCQAVGQAITFLIDKKSMDPFEAVESVCDRLLETAVLQQTRNGLRYWDLSAMRTSTEEAQDDFPFTSNIDKAERKGSKAPVLGPDGKEPEDPFQVTYHTPEERIVLPCAHFFLKHYCEESIEKNEEAIEECFRTFKMQVKKGEAEDKILVATASTRASVDRGGKMLNRDVAVEALRHCLTVPMCEIFTKDCHARIVAMKEEEEVAAFRKYQATYGSKQFPYVPDRLDRKMYEKNPFGKGMPREGENELLKTPLEEL